MNQPTSERYKSIYEAWLAEKSTKKVAMQFGISWQRVQQIVKMYRRQISRNQSLLKSDDPLRIAVAQGKMASNILTSLVRGGYGSDFNFDDLVNFLRSNTLKQERFQNFGPKSLITLRELFLSQAEIDALPVVQAPSSKWWLRSKSTLPESSLSIPDEQKSKGK